MVLSQLKKLGLLGVGAASLSAEKISEKVDELVAKGHLTVNEGKNLTEKLIKEKKGQATAEGREKLEQVLLDMNIAQQKDIDQLEEKIANLERRLDGQSDSE